MARKQNNYIRFSGMAIQMGVIIGLFAWGGVYLDEKYNQGSTQFYTLICSLLGIGIALYLVIKQVMQISKENEN